MKFDLSFLYGFGPGDKECRWRRHDTLHASSGMGPCHLGHGQYCGARCQRGTRKPIEFFPSLTRPRWESPPEQRRGTAKHRKKNFRGKTFVNNASATNVISRKHVFLEKNGFAKLAHGVTACRLLLPQKVRASPVLAFSRASFYHGEGRPKAVRLLARAWLFQRQKQQNPKIRFSARRPR